MFAPAPALLMVLCLVSAQAPTPLSERPRSILAPSLPQLTLEEEKALDGLIDRFMKADIGTLTGTEGALAVREFQALGMESVPALIRGLNRAVEMNHTCPTLQLSRKLMGLLGKSVDPELIEFARDNIGAGVSDRSRYKATLQSMRTDLMFRQNALARLNPQPRLTTTPPATPAELGSRDPQKLATPELVRLLKAENGEPVVRILRELETRKGPEVLTALASRANGSTSDVRQLSRDLLLRHVGRMDVREVLAIVEHADVEVRRTAVEVVLEKHPTSLGKLIDRLSDPEEAIRQTIRQALVRDARTVDFGPEANAPEADARKARDRWRAWWTANRR